MWLGYVEFSILWLPKPQVPTQIPSTLYSTYYTFNQMYIYIFICKHTHTQYLYQKHRYDIYRGHGNFPPNKKTRGFSPPRVLEVWSAETGKCSQVLAGHDDDVREADSDCVCVFL